MKSLFISENRNRQHEMTLCCYCAAGEAGAIGGHHVDLLREKGTYRIHL